MFHMLFGLLLVASTCLQSPTWSSLTAPTTSEDIRVNLWFDMYNFTNFRIVCCVEIRVINLQELNSTLPEKYINADEIRENLSLGQFSVADIEKAYIAKLVENISSYLCAKFGSNSTIAREWDSASLNAPPAPPGEEPPLRYYINYSQKVWLGNGIDEELILGILNDGAVYNQIFTPLPLSYPSTINLTLPEGAAIPDFPFPTNGTWSGRHYYVWDGNIEVKLGITGISGKTYRQSLVNLSVVIDMHTLANVHGKEYLYTSVNISADVHVIAIPEELKKELPERFEMNFIGADGIRLVIAKNVVNLTYIYETLNKTLSAGKEKIVEMFKCPVEFETLPIENLSWDGNWKKMDENPPVHLSFMGNAKLDFGDYIKRYRKSLSLSYTYSLRLPAIEDTNITYTVIFPKNIEIVHVECNAPHEKHYVNGRDAVSVHITNSSEMLRIQIKISFEIDFERLYPFLLLLGIFIGIWITVSILVYRKRRWQNEREIYHGGRD